jgi:hypothetical protein
VYIATPEINAAAIAVAAGFISLLLEVVDPDGTKSHAIHGAAANTLKRANLAGSIRIRPLRVSSARLNGCHPRNDPPERARAAPT